MVAVKDIYQLLLDKIPTYRELDKIPVNECGEPLVELKSDLSMHVINLDQNMRPYTGDRIFVRKQLKKMLSDVAEYIARYYPTLMLQVYYGYRHPEIQTARYKEFYSRIENNSDILDKEQYTHTFIAHPSVAGHPTGGAVDVTLIDEETKQPIDMGTELREFSEHTLTFCPFISKQAWRNRSILRTAMTSNNFAPYDGEWWHFSYGDKEWAHFYKKENAIYAEIFFTKK